MALDRGSVAAAKLCPFCVEAIQASARVCQYCQNDLTDDGANPAMITARVDLFSQICPVCEPPDQRALSKAAALPRWLPLWSGLLAGRIARRNMGIALLCFLGAMALYSELTFSRGASLNKDTLPVNARRAWTDCTALIQKTFTHVAAPHFPALANPDVSISPLAGDQWLVQGYVDVQDDTGASSRRYFLCQIAYDRATVTMQQFSITQSDALND